MRRDVDHGVRLVAGDVARDDFALAVLLAVQFDQVIGLCRCGFPAQQRTAPERGEEQILRAENAHRGGVLANRRHAPRLHVRGELQVHVTRRQLEAPHHHRHAVHPLHRRRLMHAHGLLRVERQLIHQRRDAAARAEAEEARLRREVGENVLCELATGPWEERRVGEEEGAGEVREEAARRAVVGRAVQVQRRPAPSRVRAQRLGVKGEVDIRRERDDHAARGHGHGRTAERLFSGIAEGLGGE